MDPSFQYQGQYATPQSYNPPPAPSEFQSYSQQPTQSHYLFHHQYNQAQQYPYYPPTTHYPNAYHQQQTDQEPAPIHPPGVPVQPDPSPYGFGRTHVPNQQNSYYPQEGLEQQRQQQQLGYSDPGFQEQHWQGNEVGLLPLYSQTGQAQRSGAGRSGGRGGGGPASRGRGRGRGRSGTTAPRPPPRMAWCELCRVDCNTPEILEMHKSGKRHKKNLRVQEELKTLAQKTQGPQMSNTQFIPEAASALPGNVGVPNGKNPPVEQAATEENKVPEGQGSGLKRKKKGGPGGKRMKTNDGSSKLTDPPKQKEIVPFICELCSVKCESTIVFDSHLKGKKHLFNLQRFQEQQATLGQAALQALYPALQAALLQALSQPNVNASTSSGTTGLDQQVVQWLQAFLPQAGGPPASVSTPALEPQTQQEDAIQGSNLGGGSQIGLTEGAENQPEPEIKIEELDSKGAELTK